MLYFTSLSAFAELGNRGRLDNNPGDNEWVIALLFLIGLVGVFSFFFLWDFWLKNKEEIIGFAGTVLIVGLLGFVCYGIYHLISSADSEKTEETNIPISNNTTNSKVDSWSSYPPIIADGTQKTNKDNDFLLAAILNPTFNLSDYYQVLHLTPQNTQFLSYERYCRSEFVRQRYTPSEFRRIYDNVGKAWPIFCRLQDVNFQDPEIIKYMIDYSFNDASQPNIDEASNPQLIRNLKIIPLFYSEESETSRIGIL